MIDEKKNPKKHTLEKKAKRKVCKEKKNKTSK